MKKTGAVILAAGMSKRMKAFKPLLPYAGTTMAGHMADLLIKLGADPVYFVTGYRADELEEALLGRNVRFVRNERYADTQMFDSVRTGITEVSKYCERVMLMPVDIPAIREETVRHTMMIDAPLIRTMCGGRPGHPVIMEKDIIPLICSYTGNRGLRGAMEECGVRITELEVDDEYIYQDADTREEYLSLLNADKRVEAYIQLRLRREDTFFGPGSCELLELIEKKGSIRAACAEMSLSYTKGMRIIKSAEKELEFRIVERFSGGSGGGGSSLTEDGKRLVGAYRETEAWLMTEAAKLFAEKLKRS